MLAGLLDHRYRIDSRHQNRNLTNTTDLVRYHHKQPH